MLSLARMARRFYLFARANLKLRGGRFFQVAISAADDPVGPYGPFELLKIRGYEGNGTGSVYFATVKEHPLRPGRMLLGLFPVNLGVVASDHPRSEGV